MIWIFDKEDRLALICSNDLPEALPLISATMHEVLNGDLLLTFEVPLEHSKAIEIEEGYTAAMQRESGAYECFIIGEIEQNAGTQSTLLITCRHAVTELQDDVIEYYNVADKSAAAVLPDLLAGTRWEAGTIINTELHDFTLENETVLNGLKRLLNLWNCEISYSFTISSQGIVKRTIHLYEQIGQDAGRRFEWGQDLQEIQRTVNIEGVKTALIGIGKIPATGTAEEAPLYFTNLIGKGESINGVHAGAELSGNIFDLNKNYAGAANDGEILVNAGTITDSKGRKITVIGAKELSTNLEGTVYGSAYLMYIGGDYTRFGTKPYTNSTEQFIFATYDAAAGWQYQHNTSTKYKFTPIDSDFIIGEMIRETGSAGITRIDYYAITSATKPAGQRYVENTEAREKYGRKNADGSKRNRFGFFIDNEITDPTQLLEKTWEALQDLSQPHVTYRAKVLDLAKIEGRIYKEVNLGDIVRVLDDDLNIQVKARCLEIKHNLLEPEETELLLDNFQDIFTGTAEEIEHITQRIGTVERQIGEKIQRGETIQTDWLEDDIALLRERVLAGGGTVTINDNDGILIEEDPTGKTGGALRLLGGTLALADSWNAGTGQYNWQTFGTGEGILADLITARKISFDHAHGGTLTLGGENNTNGVLQVQNATGDIIVTLDGTQGGFNELFVGTLRGDNVVLKNTKGSFTYYVDPVAGNDDNNGLTTATAFKTLQKAIDTIPNYNNDSINIVVQGTGVTFVENISVIGIMGAGRIGIYLGRKNIMKGYFLIKNNMNEVFIGTIVGAATATTPVGADRAQIQGQANTNGSSVVYSFMNMMCNLYDVIISGNSVVSYGFNAYNGVTRLQYCEIYNCTAYAGIFQANGSGDVTSCAGSNPRGLRIAHGTTIGGSGTGFFSEISGQEKVIDQGAVCNVTWSYNAGSKTPTYAPVTVSTWSANDTGSLFGTNWGVTTDYIMTGQRNTSEVAWKGFAFFNTASFAVLKNADGTNRPITKVRVLLQRYNGYGDNNSRKPKIWSSTQAASSGTPPAGSNGTLSAVGFLWGESKWVDLPIAIGQAFQAGTAKSLMFDNGNDLANYMRFEAKATLEITHG